MPVEYLKGLVDYWRGAFDWRRQEAEFNQIPQSTTTIDGTNVHFLHIESPESDALPLIVTHGWPGSVFEFLNIIGPLTDPRKYGGDPADAFHAVVPSIPGFGFSGPTRETGWNVARVARAWAELMTRLGYARYGAQGGDLGAMISPDLGRIAPDRVAGVHVNAASVGFIPFAPLDDSVMAELTDREKVSLTKIEKFTTDQWGYNAMQSTRPQTLAYGLTDSPVGQLAWIVEKFKEWTDDDKDLPEEAVDRDQMLANVTLYWLTRTAGSSAQIYYENMHSISWAPPERSPVPTAVANFAQDVAIRRFGEPAHNIVRWTDFDQGGHFAAMETPNLLVDDIREFFRRLR